MPKTAVPLTFAGVSRRFARVPIRREILRLLERDVFRDRHERGVGGELAIGGALRRSRGEGLRRVAAWQEDGSTFQRFAAAATSMVLATAPASRSGFHAARIEVEPPVAWMPPNTGFP